MILMLSKAVPCAIFVAGGCEIYRNLLLWPANFTATAVQGRLLSLNEPRLDQLKVLVEFAWQDTVSVIDTTSSEPALCYIMLTIL